MLRANVLVFAFKAAKGLNEACRQPQEGAQQLQRAGLPHRGGSAQRPSETVVRPVGAIAVRKTKSLARGSSLQKKGEWSARTQTLSPSLKERSLSSLAGYSAIIRSTSVPAAAVSSCVSRLCVTGFTSGVFVRRMWRSWLFGRSLT